MELPARIKRCWSASKGQRVLEVGKARPGRHPSGVAQGGHALHTMIADNNLSYDDCILVTGKLFVTILQVGNGASAGLLVAFEFK